MLGEKWLMLDSQKLMDCIWKKKLTEQDVANYLKISKFDLYQKIFIYKHFSREDVNKLEKLLELSKVEREMIFKI